MIRLAIAPRKGYARALRAARRTWPYDLLLAPYMFGAPDRLLACRSCAAIADASGADVTVILAAEEAEAEGTSYFALPRRKSSVVAYRIDWRGRWA